MATIQVRETTRRALQQWKREQGARSMDAVLQHLLSPTPDKEHILATLRHLGPALLHHGVTSIRLFGSVARGTATPGADIDLIVELDDDRDYTELARIQRLLEAALGAPCDVVLPGALHPRLAADILNHAEEVPLGP